MSSLFFIPEKEVVYMWNLITYFLCFTGGTMVEVVLMCLLQAGKFEDEQKGLREWRDCE